MAGPLPAQESAASYTQELLLESTIKRRFGHGARFAGYQERPAGTQGYSGATLRVFDVDVIDGCSLYAVPLVTKDGHLIERKVMLLLDEQEHPNVPFSFSFDYMTNERMLLCQQYIEANTEPWGDSTVQQAALDLARIHVANMGQAQALDWLPRADRAFFAGEAMVKGWHAAWTHALDDREFADLYGRYTAPLEHAASVLLQSVGELWDEGDTLTLVHGDLHDGNIVAQDGYAYFIDWEMARYGSFYIDLPNYFSPRRSLEYRDALASLGYDVPLATFKQRYADVTRSLGFRYMPHWLALWERGGPDRERSRHPISALITTALTGVPTP